MNKLIRNDIASIIYAGLINSNAFQESDDTLEGAVDASMFAAETFLKHSETYDERMAAVNKAAPDSACSACDTKSDATMDAVEAALKNIGFPPVKPASAARDTRTFEALVKYRMARCDAEEQAVKAILNQLFGKLGKAV